MESFHLSYKLFVILLVVQRLNCYPERGKWQFDINNKEQLGPYYESIVVSKSLYNNSYFSIGVDCQSASDAAVISLKWFIRKPLCWREYEEVEKPISKSPDETLRILNDNGLRLTNRSASIVSGTSLVICDGKTHYLISTLTSNKFELTTEIEKQAKNNSISSNKSNQLPVISPMPLSAESGLVRTKRTAQSNSLIKAVPKHRLFSVPYDGIYQLILGVNFSETSEQVDVKLLIKIRSDYGYISAADYPLLVFYSTMCAFYVIFAISWLVLCFMRWRDLLRVQYWIGAVILLGMIEKAVFTAEYESVNREGISTRSMILFAELVSCLKRTLARILVVIVCFGFGIVKPRLGVVLNRVLVVGLIYFLLSSIEGSLRVLRPRTPDPAYSNRLMFSIIPLALLESALCWWMFSALTATIRTLELRKNTIKLKLYRHFTHTLIFAVVTSIIFMLWSIQHQNWDDCLSDWKQLWVDDAFWHILFAIILVTIMFLWRPTNNTQRFAFSPLLDDISEASEEEYNKLMTDVNDMKMRTSKKSEGSENGLDPIIQSDSRMGGIEEDLKWAEENIPSGVTDTGMPMIVDSGDEVVMTTFERSKMQ